MSVLIEPHAVTSQKTAFINVKFLRGVLQLLVTANAIPSSLIISTLMMDVMRSSETSVLTRVTRHIPEDGIFPGIL
jgi:hypothetical protein